MNTSDPSTGVGAKPIPLEPVLDGVDVQRNKAQRTLKIKKLQAAVFNGSLVDVSRYPTTYKYKSIDYHQQIRVLKIYPGQGNAELECRLLPIVLEGAQAPICREIIGETIKYTALSYYWGQDTATHKVYMYEDDRLQNVFATMREPNVRRNLLKQVGFTYIQNNLNKVLRQIRDEEDEVYVWADALCIHQNDVLERSAQVSQMHDVYMQADNVCVWLGDADRKEAENRMTFKFLNDILDLPYLELYVERLQRKDKEALDACAGVFGLMESDWFKRRWVIQELALASHAEVRRGDCTMPWLDFADSISLFMTKHEDIRRAHSLPRTYDASLNQEQKLMESLDPKALPANILVMATSNFFRKSNEGQIQQRLLSLEQLVSSMLLAFEATDPKDTIFAVLQIAKDTFKTQSMEHLDIKTKLMVPAFWFGMALLFAIFMQHLNAKALYQALIAQLRGVMTSFKTSSLDRDPTIIMGFRLILQGCFMALLALFTLAVCTLTISILWKGLTKALLRSSGIQSKALVDKRIEPKYEKCIRDVFGDFIEYCVETSDSLDVLCRHWAPVVSKPDEGKAIPMPSWILSINGHAFGGPKKLLQTRINGDSLVGGSENRSFYRASGSLRPSYRFGKNKVAPETTVKPSKQHRTYAETIKAEELPQRFDGILDVKGVQLCTIEQSAAIIGGVISEQALELLGWRREKEISKSNMDQIWRTLVANRGPGGTNPPSWYRRVCQSCLEWYKRQGITQFSTNTLKILPGTPPAKVEFIDRVQQVVWGKKCFRSVTKDQREIVGLVPPTSEAKDLICVLFGCSVPVVLRERKATKDFQFIGECYVHGMMDGEAVEPNPRRNQIRWFRLR